jgi:hypothetical protein
MDVRLVHFILDDDGYNGAPVFAARERIDEMAIDRRQAKDEQAGRLPARHRNESGTTTVIVKDRRLAGRDGGKHLAPVDGAADDGSEQVRIAQHAVKEQRPVDAGRPRLLQRQSCYVISPALSTTRLGGSCRLCGEMAEWLKAPHSKCGVGATLPGVRIPLSPPSTV